MDLTLGPLALLVVHRKLYAMLMTWCFLDNPRNSRYFSLLKVEKAVTADQAANTLKEQRWFTSQFFCQHHYLY